jgi:Streptomyces sporulation and cell division protein, SsgA
VPPHDELVRLPARAFVLGDDLDVDVFACTATVWHPRTDPGRLHLLLAGDADDTATIAIDLDLLTGGMNARVDRGRVTVWPCWDDEVVCLGLRGPRHAVVEFARPALADVLADVAGPADILRPAADAGRQAPVS